MTTEWTEVKKPTCFKQVSFIFIYTTSWWVFYCRSQKWSEI